MLPVLLFGRQACFYQHLCSKKCCAEPKLEERRLESRAGFAPASAVLQTAACAARLTGQYLGAASVNWLGGKQSLAAEVEWLLPEIMLARRTVVASGTHATGLKTCVPIRTDRDHSVQAFHRVLSCLARFGLLSSRSFQTGNLCVVCW